MYYAGVGSRKTPTDVQQLCTSIAEHLEQHYGYILRSGGAEGADLAFERGSTKNEIFTVTSKLDHHISLSTIHPRIVASAEKIARRFHPKWQALTTYHKQLMTRNVFQVLGSDLITYSDFVVCWTVDGIENGNNTSINTGGTGQAIRIAQHYEIPVFNVFNIQRAHDLFTWLDNR